MSRPTPETTARWARALRRVAGGAPGTGNWHTESALLNRGLLRLEGPAPVRARLTAAGAGFLRRASASARTQGEKR